MRIALFTDGIYPYVIGGMQKHSFYLAKYFARNKVHIDLYHPIIDIKEVAFLNCFATEEKEYIHPIFVVAPKSIYFPGHYIYESYTYSKNVYLKYIQNKKPDFIYAQGFVGWELIKQKKNGNVSIPSIGVNFHGLNMFQPAFGFKNMLNNCLFRLPARFNLKNTDYIFSLGPKLSELIVQNGINIKNIINVPVGIDDSWLIGEHEIKNNPVISFVFVGRYDRIKGIALLNVAIRNVLKKNSSFFFNFIGPFPPDAQLKHPNIFYHGEIKDDLLLKSIVRKNDVIVSSGFSEGMPTVIIEAMATGLAVISTDVGAVSELVDEKNGLLIPPGSFESIENAMIKFIKMDKIDLLNMKKCSLNKVKKRFLWEGIVAKTIEEIEKLVMK